jgi:fructokinase
MAISAPYARLEAALPRRPDQRLTGLRIGIDLGGTKIEGLALGPGGVEMARQRIATPRDYEGTLDAIVGIVADLESKSGGIASIGVGLPGTISPATGVVKNANSTWLIGHPLDKDLARRLKRPVRLSNDANCFALSEAADGAGRAASVVFGVILGTGVGGGFVVDGHVLEGAQRVAGEWGHNPIPWPQDSERPGPPCYCGKQGCIETYLSGPGLERDHRSITGHTRTTYEIADGIDSRDPEALETFSRYVHRLARALATVVNVVDPDVVVLGGGMSNLPGLARATRSALPAWVFSDAVSTEVVLNQHGDSSGVRGAAWLWPDQPEGR